VDKNTNVIILNASISDPKSSIEKIQKKFSCNVQFINSNSYYDINSVIWAVRQTHYARKNKTKVTDNFNIELLLRLASTNQIKEAIAKVGITNDNKIVTIILFGKKSDIAKAKNWFFKNSTIKNISYKKNKKLIPSEYSEKLLSGDADDISLILLEKSIIEFLHHSK